MAYQPNPTDASAAYMAAAAWQNQVPLDAIDQPALVDVEEMAWGEYHILDGRQRDACDQPVAPLAVCAYDGEAEQWEVYLPDSDTVIVRVEDDEFMVVVT